MNRKPLVIALSALTAAGLGAAGWSSASQSAGAAPATGSSIRAAAHRPSQVTRVTRASLPPASTIRLDGRAMVTTASFPGSGRPGLSLCQTAPWQQFGSNATWTRQYRARTGGSSARAAVQVASFPTHAAAVKAAARMQASLRCRAGVESVPGLAPNSQADFTRTTVLRGGQRVFLNHSIYSIEGQSTDTHEDTAVYATGNHAALVTLHYRMRNRDDAQLVRTVRATLPTVAR